MLNKVIVPSVRKHQLLREEVGMNANAYRYKQLTSHRPGQLEVMTRDKMNDGVKLPVF